MTTTHPVLIPRCKWCQIRIGVPRYRFVDKWTGWNDDYWTVSAQFTDGICPECKAKMMEEINKPTV